MPQKIVAAVLACVVVIIVGCLAGRIFAKDIVHEPTTQPSVGTAEKPASPLDFVVTDIDGKEVHLSDYRGKVVLIVNVASKCGFTKQYASLETLYKTYADKGLVILGFPADNFAHQEPGSNAEIKAFCTSKFDVTFPMMAKISVKGDDQAPLYKFLTDQATAGEFKGEIGWNFTKFLVDRNGNVMGRFASNTDPGDAKVKAAIEAAIAAK
jgi:glutathione peroxidase